MNFIFILKLILMNDINQLKHFDALDYKGEYFTNELKDGEEFLYSTIKIQDDSKMSVDANNTDLAILSDYTHLFGYLNPYYRTVYSIPKRKR